MDKIEVTQSHFTDLRDLIAETAADLSNAEPFWTAGCLADALIKKGVVATCTDATPVVTDVAALVEAAFREGWHDGMMAQGYGGSIESTDDDDWAASKARQALAPFTKGQNDDAVR